ncbi:MAG: hypothetical protein LH466_02415 [Sphingomonas bacterium]|nr:hypothetical protein [Sphingomonas bacterium]
MIDPNDNKPNYLGRATDEVKAMGREGFANPTTKKVLAGAAIGAVAGLLLPVLSIPIGVIGGAGIALWQRIKR